MEEIMKRYGHILAYALVGISLTGCMSPQGRPDYTASGALAGGATGAIIGSMTRNPGAGSAVGAAVGAVVGGMIGHGMDQEQEARLRAQYPQTLQRVEQSQPLTVYDVESLVKAGIGDDLIISQIRNTRTVYHLQTADIINLRNAGVSNRIIDFMINTPSEIPTSEVSGVIGNTPPALLPEVIVPAPSPDYIWVGGTWLWFGDHWGWHRGYWHRPVRPYYYRHGHHRR